MITSLVELGHPGAVMVHLIVAEVPSVIPLSVELGAAGVTREGEPEITDHNPEPTAGVLAARVVEVRLQRF